MSKKTVEAFFCDFCERKFDENDLAFLSAGSKIHGKHVNTDSHICNACLRGRTQPSSYSQSYNESYIYSNTESGYKGPSGRPFATHSGVESSLSE